MSMKTLILASQKDNTNPAAVEYAPLCNGNKDFSATESDVLQVIPAAGVLKNLYAWIDDSPGVGDSWDFTVMKNGSPTSLEVVLGETPDGNDDVYDNNSTDVVSVSPGDTVSLRLTPNGTPTSSSQNAYGCTFQSTDDNVSPMLFNSDQTDPLDATEYGCLQGTFGWGSGANGDRLRAIVSTSGTLSHLYLVLDVAPGAGTGNTFTVYKNSVATNISVTISETNTTGNNTSDVVSLVAGDEISLVKTISAGTPVAVRVAGGIRFNPTTNGESLILKGTDDVLNTTTTSFDSILGDLFDNTTPEKDYISLITEKATISKFYFTLSGAVGGTSRTALVRKSTFPLSIADSGITVTITNPSSSGSDLVNRAEFDPGDAISFKFTVVGTTNSTYWRSGLLCYISPVEMEFSASASSEFLNLQSGSAKPAYYIEGIISGVTSVVGVSYDLSRNYLVDGGVIDRERPIFPGDRSNIFSADVTLKMDNSTRRFSPRDSSSIFFGNDYLESVFNYWAGFVNVSGTAILVQRGSFVLEGVTVDSRETMAYLKLRDKFKRPLTVEIATPQVSGTSTQFVITGIQLGNGVISSLMITGAGLTSTDLDFQTASISFDNLSLDNQSVAEAASLVAEASDGYLYTNRRGILTFRVNEPSFTAATASFVIRESNYAMNMMAEETINDRLYKVSIGYLSGTSVFAVSETTGITGNHLTITNDSIQAAAEAFAIANRLRDRFSGTVTRLQIRSVWLPSLDINDRIEVHSTALGLSASLFEIYKIQEEPTRNLMTINALTLRGERSNDGNKFGFFSDPSAVACGTVFTGLTGEANGWQAGYAFFCTETTTAVTPGFDADGDANNVINSGVTSSGAGGTGIEIPFLFY